MWQNLSLVYSTLFFLFKAPKNRRMNEFVDISIKKSRTHQILINRYQSSFLVLIVEEFLCFIWGFRRFHIGDGLRPWQKAIMSSEFDVDLGWWEDGNRFRGWLVWSVVMANDRYTSNVRHRWSMVFEIQFLIVLT